MNLRYLIVIALLLLLGAVGAWVWFGKDGAPTALAVGSEVTSSATTAEHSRSGESPIRATSPALVSAPSEPQTPAIVPAEPRRMTSSVAPGMPMVRTTPVPVRPVIAAPAGTRPPASQPEPQAEAKADLEGIQFMFRDFRTRMGENPVGSNAEIMRAVMGGNEVKARLGPPPGQRLNDQGELVDRWGNAYFFHQLSKTSMEIRSAGPDGRLWTVDDLVTK